MCLPQTRCVPKYDGVLWVGTWAAGNFMFSPAAAKNEELDFLAAFLLLLDIF